MTDMEIIMETRVETEMETGMNDEMTLGDIFDDIAERLAQARTRALMGERQDALGLMRAAALEYQRFREALQDYPGHHALAYAFDVTMDQLCAEQSQLQAPAAEAARPKLKPRRKAEKAA